ncbi:putative ubiquitinyl hydrolase 1 [Dioscorea sansibarensis]
MMPRGLKNPGNLCFVNATLQALLSCTPFVQLVRNLGKCSIQRDEHPSLHAFASFISKFDIPHYQNNERREPFSASMFKGIIEKFIADLPPCPSDGRKTRVDAQEFLVFIMDRMHEDLLKLRGSSSVQDDWETIQRNNKYTEIWTKKFVASELSDMFWGQERIIINRNDQIVEIVRPFLVLHLDIRPSTVHTIEDSLQLYFGTEKIEGYESSKIRMDFVENNNDSKSVKIEELPNILVLHLMRFSFENSGFVKIDKRVKFPPYLEIENDILANPSRHKGILYELVGSITHHGRKTSTGHYTADVKYPDGQWMHCDDEEVTTVSLSNVLHEGAYILLYERVCCC